MTRRIRKLLNFFIDRKFEEVSLDWLVRKSGKSRGTVIRYVNEVRRHLPRRYQIDMFRRDGKTYYKLRPTAESFRRQQRILEVG